MLLVQSIYTSIKVLNLRNEKIHLLFLECEHENEIKQIKTSYEPKWFYYHYKVS